jgi:hypothetical protein
LVSKLLGRFCQWFGLKTTETIFSSLASKLVAMVFSGLASKPVATVSPGLASKPVARVSWFGLQNRQLQFGDLGFKITMTISWFVPQNQVGDGLSGVPQNRYEDEDDVRHVLRSSSLLHVEAGRARVSQFASKLAEAQRWVPS